MPEPVTQPEVKPTETPVTESAQTQPTKPELPKKDFFKGDNMKKWMEQSSMFQKKEPAPVTATPTSEKKPCTNCPPGETQVKAQTRQPITTLNIDGKEIPVYDQATIHFLEQRGYKVVKADDTEIRERESKLNEAYDALEKMRQAIDSGEIIVKKKENSDENEIDAEAMDPATRRKFEDLQAKIKVLEGETEYVKKRREAEQFDSASKALNEWYAEATKDTPIEQYVDPDTGVNLTEKVLAGLLTVKASEDAVKMQAGKIKTLRPMKEYIKEAVQDIHRLQQRGATSSPITAESIIKNNPAVAEEIGQQAIARYLKKQSGAAPNARAFTDDIKKPSGDGKTRTFTSLDDAMEQAKRDPAAMAGLRKRLARDQS